LRSGARLGVDVGSVRIGIAVSDPDGILATPVATVRRGKDKDDDYDVVGRIARLSAERAAIEVVVGLPVSLSGHEGQAARSVRHFATRLARKIAPVPVRMVDERMTTGAAWRDMRASGISERRGRSTVDQAAAVIILQGALDAERATGQPPGEIMRVDT
jgi:putative holliday junction resolvase